MRAKMVLCFRETLLHPVLSESSVFWFCSDLDLLGPAVDLYGSQGFWSICNAVWKNDSSCFELLSVRFRIRFKLPGSKDNHLNKTWFWLQVWACSAADLLVRNLLVSWMKNQKEPVGLEMWITFWNSVCGVISDLL